MLVDSHYVLSEVRGKDRLPNKENDDTTNWLIFHASLKDLENIFVLGCFVKKNEVGVVNFTTFHSKQV